MTTLCPFCGLRYEPGGGTCREHGCPLAAAGCRTLHCPRCGYAVPDENESVAARWVRRLFGPGPAKDAQTLADLSPGEEATIDRLLGQPALRARLSAQGLTPGVGLRLLQRRPSFVVEVGETTLALERSVARQVGLRPRGLPEDP